MSSAANTVENNIAVKEEKQVGYKDLLKQKEYLKLLFANVISRFGDSVDELAFTWLVYRVTGSAAWSAILFALNQLPSIIVQPFTGALVEGMNKKRLMVVTDVIRGMIVAALAVLYMTENVTPLILVLFTLIISTVEAFRMPAGMCVFPMVLKEEQYEFGTSLSSIASTVVELIGVAAAGIIIGAFGIGTAILIDAATFVGSALVLSFLKIKEEHLQRGEVDAKGYVNLLKEGIVYLKNEEVIRNFCLMAVIVNAVIVPFNALQSPIICDVLGQNAEFLSVFGISMLAFMGIGSLFFPYISKKFSVRGILVGSGIGIGASFALLTLGKFLQGSIVAIYVITILATAVLGISANLLMSVLNVQFMKVVKQEYLARVGSIFNAGSSAATPVASFLVSALALKFTVGQILIVSAALCGIIFVYIAVRKVRFE